MSFTNFYFVETLRQENEQLQSNTTVILTENEELKLSAADLHIKVETTNSVVIRLTEQMTQLESELSAYRIEKRDLVDERDQLRKMAGRKDCHIDHLNENIKRLDEQLQSAVAAKYDALSRLDQIEGKEQTIDHKERQMEMEKELLNSEIANLRDNLNRNMAELMALRHENTSTTVQCDIELKQKTEELRIASATINQMTETNQSLTNQCEDNIQVCILPLNPFAHLFQILAHLTEITGASYRVGTNDRTFSKGIGCENQTY